MTQRLKNAAAHRARRTSAVVALLLAAAASPAHALLINVTFEHSTSAAPAAFFSTFNSVVQSFQATYNDPITINLVVGWGSINGSPLVTGLLGQSQINPQAVGYDALRAALVSDAKTVSDNTAVASLPATNPTPRHNWVMSNAEAKALGLLSGSAAGTDGWVGFNASASYNYTPQNGAVAGAYDFVGLAQHEITEVMGRYGYGQNGGGGNDSPIDLFRYATTGGARLLAPSYAGPANYFSINGGSTVINSFNTTCCGDLSDWFGTTVDAYNAFVTLGAVAPTSEGDLVLMDVLGYDRVAAVPELGTVWLMALGLAGLPMARRVHRKA